MGNKLLEILEKGNIKSDKTSSFVLCVLDKKSLPSAADVIASCSKEGKIPIDFSKFQIISRHYNSVHGKKACSNG